MPVAILQGKVDLRKPAALSAGHFGDRMKTITLTIAILLVGCATVQDVQRAHSGELCYRVATGKTAGLSPSVFWQELSNRGENCQQYQAMIQSRSQADQAQMQQAIQLLQSAQPRAPQPSPPPQYTRCNTVPNGYGGWRTVCD